MSRTVEEFEADGDDPEVWDDARAWADRNGYSVFEDYPKDGVLAVKIGEFKYVTFDRYGGVTKIKQRSVGSGETEVHFGDKQITIRDDRGNEFHISEKKFSI